MSPININRKNKDKKPNNGYNRKRKILKNKIRHLEKWKVAWKDAISQKFRNDSWQKTKQKQQLPKWKTTQIRNNVDENLFKIIELKRIKSEQKQIKDEFRK